MSGPSAGPARSDALVELCAFRVGGEEYVLDIRRIREIVNPLPITSVPRAPEWMEGVMNLRGEVIPVVDVRRRLRIQAAPPTRRAKVLIVQVAGRVLGLVVDAVSEVVRIPRSEIGPPPALMAATGSRMFLGVVGARGAGARGGKARAPENGPAGRDGTRPAAPSTLRLLLNVKALLEPVPPAPGAPPPGGREA